MVVLRVIGPETAFVPFVRSLPFDEDVAPSSVPVPPDRPGCVPAAPPRDGVATWVCDNAAGVVGSTGGADGSVAPVSRPSPLVDDGGSGSWSSVRFAGPPVEARNATSARRPAAPVAPAFLLRRRRAATNASRSPSAGGATGTNAPGKVLIPTPPSRSGRRLPPAGCAPRAVGA